MQIYITVSLGTQLYNALPNIDVPIWRHVSRLHYSDSVTHLLIS